MYSYRRKIIFDSDGVTIIITQKIFDGITTAWSDKRQPIQHRLHFKKQV